MLCLGIKPKGHLALTDRDTGRRTTVHNVQRSLPGGAVGRLMRIETDPLKPGDRITIERADGRRYVLDYSPRPGGHPDGQQIRIGLTIPRQTEALRDDVKNRREEGSVQ